MKDTSVGRHMSARSESSVAAPNAALLIDFDNVTMGIRSDLQNQLRRLLNSDMIKGKVSVQRAYADWRRYPQYIVPLSEASIDLIFAPAFGANKKNATDIRLAIDALELIFIRPEIGTFILLSGDSDFSALVLKLKEYGKYVIGVGIRESSSDLLIQNCDEYFSYNEITGLAKEGGAEQVRRDPWELVVEAVQKMVRDGDVMRSDRLKQVMQAIDPNFDEKDAGFNRFSKFVLSSAQRGLLALTKMENGQYAIDIGTNANVRSDEQPAGGKEDESKDRPAARRKRARRRTVPAEDSANLTLSDGFDLLKRALAALGAVGEDSTDYTKTRDKMIELHGNESDPMFENRRFLRMLRQAHDADFIELIKGDGDEYLLKLGAKSSSGGEQEAQEVTPTVEEEEAPMKTKRTTRRKSTTPRRSPRTKKADDVAEAEGVVSTIEATSESASGDEAPTSKTPKRRTKTTSGRSTRPKGRTTAKDSDERDVNADRTEGKPPEERKPVRRNPRLRHGSRKPTPGPNASDGQQESAEVAEVVAPTVARAPTTGPRTLGSRRGSRGRRPSDPQPESTATEEQAPSREAPVAQSGPSAAAEPIDDTLKAGRVGEKQEEAKGRDGLLHKLTAAIQKAVGGTSPEDPDSE